MRATVDSLRRRRATSITVQARQPDVEHNQVEAVLRREAQRSQAFVGNVDGVPPQAQDFGEHLGAVVVVVDDEDVQLGRGRRSALRVVSGPPRRRWAA